GGGGHGALLDLWGELLPVRCARDVVVTSVPARIAPRNGDRSAATGHTVPMVDVSPREAEVLALVGEQLTNPEIAARLYISVRTVESHVSSLLRKLGVDVRRALVALAAAGPVALDGAGASSGDGRPGGLQGAPEAFTSFIGRDDDV